MVGKHYEAFDPQVHVLPDKQVAVDLGFCFVDDQQMNPVPLQLQTRAAYHIGNETAVQIGEKNTDKTT